MNPDLSGPLVEVQRRQHDLIGSASVSAVDPQTATHMLLGTIAKHTLAGPKDSAERKPRLV